MSVFATNKLVNKTNFAKEILPLIKTLNFDYIDDEVNDEVNGNDTYFMWNDKYYCIRKHKYKGNSYKFVEYRIIRQELWFNQPYIQYLSYYNNVLDRCCIKLNDVNKIKKNYKYKNDIQIEDYYIESYRRTVIPNSKCIYCNLIHRFSHNTNSKKHKANREKYIIELSKNSILNRDCIKIIMSFLFK